MSLNIFRSAASPSVKAVGPSAPALETMALPPQTPSMINAVLRGVTWTTLGRGFDRVTDLIRYIVLARLLNFEELGSFGIVALVGMGFQALTYTGFRQALIRRPADPRPLYDTTFTIEMVRGLVLAGLTCLAAPFLSSYLNAPITGLLQAESLTMIFFGAVSIGTIEFDRNLDFHKTVLMTRSATIASLVVGITLAFVLRNAWALVIADLTRAGVTMVLSYYLHPYRPKLRLNWAYASELFAFGRWLTINAIGLFFLQQFDSLFLAMRLGPMALAPYQMAYRLAMFPINSLREVIYTVMLPVFSRITDDPTRMGRAYSQIFLVLLTVVMPGALLVACYANELMFFALGPEWMPAVPIVRVLVILGLLQIFTCTIEPVFQSMGAPHIATVSQYSQMAVLIPMVWVLTDHFGAMGAAIGATLAGIVPAVILLTILIERLPVIVGPMITSSLSLVLPTAMLIATSLFVRSAMPDLPATAAPFSAAWLQSFALTLIGVMTAIAAYLVSLAVMEWVMPIGIRQIINQVRRSFRKEPASD